MNAPKKYEQMTSDVTGHNLIHRYDLVLFFKENPAVCSYFILNHQKKSSVSLNDSRLY